MPDRHVLVIDLLNVSKPRLHDQGTGEFGFYGELMFPWSLQLSFFTLDPGEIQPENDFPGHKLSNPNWVCIRGAIANSEFCIRNGMHAPCGGPDPGHQFA
jgi:hypothetical protein